MHYRKFGSLVLIGILLCMGCRKHDSETNVKVIAHAGDGIYNPARYYFENTLESLHYALSFPEIDGIEMDVQLSKDGTLWLFHDEYLEQCTNGEGQVYNLTDDYLSTITYKSLKKERLRQLSELRFEDYSTPKELYLDVKLFGDYVSDSVFVSKFKLAIDNLLLWDLPNYQLSFIINSPIIANQLIEMGLENIFSDAISYEDAQQRLSSTTYAGIFIRNNVITTTEIKNLQQGNKKVIIFGIRVVRSVRNAIGKNPYAIMPENFKVAIIEANK